MHPYVRSDIITSVETEREVLSRARVDWTADHRVRVLYVQGTHYEMGYQQGVLLREEVRDNILSLYDKAVSTFLGDELFAEAYERLRPFISQEYIDEMHGLAHGARLPLRVVQAFHALPSMAEWGGKKGVTKRVKGLAKGEIEDLGTSCSNLSAKGSHHYVVRILDWGLHKISKLHEYPLITVARPKDGIPYANIGWVGFLGAVSGINAEGITLGEMGYGSPENETLRGVPMPFLLRDVLSNAHSLENVRTIISSAKGENSYVYLMSDGKTGAAEIYVRDPDRFLVFTPGQQLVEGEYNLPGITNTVYGGHFADRMASTLAPKGGELTLDELQKEVIPSFVMDSNFQNVIYEPNKLKFWVNNAPERGKKAASEPYTEFDLSAALAGFPQTPATVGSK